MGGRSNRRKKWANTGEVKRAGLVLKKLRLQGQAGKGCWEDKEEERLRDGGQEGRRKRKVRP